MQKLCVTSSSIYLVLAAASIFVLIPCPARAESAEANSVKRFLQGLDHEKSTRYSAAFLDLNGDGRKEAIVYLAGKGWCGTSGCNTLILAQERNSWRIVSNISLTRPPIYIFDKSSYGWRHLGVWVQGGGIQPGYEAEIRFNGKRFPRILLFLRLAGYPTNLWEKS